MEDPKKSEIVYYESGKTPATIIQESENITGLIALSTAPTFVKTDATAEATVCAAQKTDLALLAAKKLEVKNLVKAIKERKKKLREARKTTGTSVIGWLNGDGVAIGALGYTTRIIGQRSPKGLCGKIMDLELSHSLNSGGVDAKWKGDKKKLIYKIQWTTGDPLLAESWNNDKNSDEPTEAKYSITNQTPGTYLHVRVCGINVAGHGTWSDVMSITVP